MDFFKRIGTDRHKFKVQFFLKTLSCNTKQLKGDIFVSIKRGEHKISSQNKVSLGDDGSCDFGKQILCFDALTLFYDSSQKKYQQKQGEVRIIIVTKKGQKKLLGTFQIDIAEYANSGKQNLQYKKQFGEKIKVIMEFDVFIKYLGEASQTSKSVDKKIQSRKQSSLSKFTSFFTGQKQQSPDNKKKQQQRQDSQDSNKRVREQKKKQTQTKPNNLKGESQNVFINKYNQNKDIKKPQPKEIDSQVNFNKKGNAGSEKKIISNDDQDSEEFDTSKNQKKNKNLVNIKQKDNFTEVQQSQDQPRAKLTKQQPIFFDQPSSINKKKATRDEQDKQVQQKSNRMKRTQYTGFTKQSNDKKQMQKQKEKQKDAPNKNKNISQFQIQSFKIDTEKMQKLEKTLKQYKQKNNSLQKQIKRLQEQNQNLNNQNVELKQKVKKFTNSRDFYETERDGTYKKVDDEKVRILEKEKGELLVKVQKLQQKYKKDFAKYQQAVEQFEDEKKQLEQASKAEIKRLKQQFSEQKDRLDKVTNKLQEKTKQAKQSKEKQNDLKERLAMAQSNLSELKLKIGDKLNEANQDGNRSVIDILTLLSQ